MDKKDDFPYPDLIVLASLFEGNFSIDWLIELTGQKSTQILNAIEEGIHWGFLAHQAPGIYVFKNSRTKEVWRNKLSETEKIRLHRTIAEMLLRVLPDNEQKSLLILDHLPHLPNDYEKCYWLMRVGDHNLKKYHTEEALQYYTQALECLSAFSNEQSDSLFCEIAIKYSRFSVARKTQKVLEIVQEAIARAQKWKKYSYLSLLKMHLAKNEWLLSRYNSALKHFEEGWLIAEQLKEPNLQRAATNFSTFFKYWQGRFREVIMSYEACTSDVAKVPQRPFPLWAAVIVGRCYFYLGKVTQGLGMLDSIRTSCLEKEDHHMAAHANFTMGVTMVDMCRLQDALGYVENSLADARKEKNNFVAILGKLALAYIHYLNGENQKAIQYLKKYLKHSQEVQVRMVIHPYMMELCWAMDQGKLPAVPGLSLSAEVKKSKRTTP
jgi:formate hydrogenlyase transcriptional activator